MFGAPMRLRRMKGDPGAGILDTVHVGAKTVLRLMRET